MKYTKSFGNLSYCNWILWKVWNAYYSTQCWNFLVNHWFKMILKAFSSTAHDFNFYLECYILLWVCFLLLKLETGDNIVQHDLCSFKASKNQCFSNSEVFSTISTCLWKALVERLQIQIFYLSSFCIVLQNYWWVVQILQKNIESTSCSVIYSGSIKNCMPRNS